MIGICVLIALLILIGVFCVYICRFKNKGWKVVDPTKKGGSFSLYFMDKHIANVRGKTKAMVLLNAIQGKDMTKDLDMTSVAAVKPVTKKVSTKKVAAKVMAKKVVAKKVTKKTSKK